MYSDKYGTFFGWKNADGNVDIVHVGSQSAATRLDATVTPVGSELSARYEHPNGITLTPLQCEKLGIEIE